jgi:formylglycine-generating enzyme required for sulfatase activity
MVDFSQLQQIYNQQTDSILAQNGLTTKCEFNFGTTNTSVCPNCIYDANLKKSSGKYKAGGPIPFVLGRLCPYCNGVGFYGITKTETGYLAIVWDYKKWINPPPQIDNPDGYIQTICDKSYLTNIKNCKDLTVIYHENNSNPVFQLYGEPNPAGLGDNKYLFCIWKKIGVSSLRANIGANIAPSPTATAIVATPTSTSIISTPTSTVVAPTPTSTVVAPTPTSTVVAPTPTSTVVAPTPTSTVVAPTPTSTNIPPTPTLPVSNTANYNNVGDWNSYNGNVTTIKTNGGSSPYGTYDQSGNVYEWMEAIAGSFRCCRGGYYASSASELSSAYRLSYNPSLNHVGLGFRVYSNGNPNAYSNFLSVSDSNNTVDSNGYGGVSYGYSVCDHTVTNQEYVEFLNSVDQSGTNPNNIYTSAMSSSGRGGIVFSSGGVTGEKYSTKINMSNKPVNYINWYNAARYSNWLHNNKPIGTPSPSTTEDGAYTLSGNTGFPNRNVSAKYFIPNENEWYKSAYYKSGGTSAGYWTYATSNNTAPTPVCANSVGDGDPMCNPTPTPSPSISPTPTSTPTPVPPTSTPTSTGIVPTPTETPTPTATNPSIPAYISQTNEAPYLGSTGTTPYPPPGWTSLLNSSVDDAFYTINLPFNWTINNTAYNIIYICTNGYITFGSGSTAYSSLSQSYPALNKIFFGADDNSAQRICYTTSGTDLLKIRFQGTAAPTGSVSNPNIVTEITLYNPTNFSGDNVAEIITGTHFRTYGLFGIASASSWYAQSSLSQNTSYVIAGNSTGTSFTIYSGMHISDL